MGGGSMLRSVRRAVGLGARRAASPVRQRSACNLPSQVTVGWSGCPAQEGSGILQPTADQWELAVDEDEERVMFGWVPTREEVQEAASDLHDALALTQAVCPCSASQDGETASSSNPLQGNSNLLEESTSVESESESQADGNAVDWMEPELHPCNRELVLQSGHNNVFDAFQLLPTNPALQRMVISLASDEAVWNAILKNESVLEFRQSLHKVAAGNSMLHEITGDSDEVSVGKQSVFISAANNIKTKMMDYVEKITELASAILGFVYKRIFAEKDGDTLDRNLRFPLLLSVAILLVVVVRRALII